MRLRLAIFVATGAAAGLAAAAYIERSGDSSNVIINAEQRLSAEFQVPANQPPGSLRIVRVEPLWSEVESIAGILVLENQRILKAKALSRYKENPGVDLRLWENREALSEAPWRVETWGDLTVKRAAVALAGTAAGGALFGVSVAFSASRLSGLDWIVIARYLAMLALMFNFLYPPWEYTFQVPGISQVGRPAGYALVFQPPQPQRSDRREGVSVDVRRLVLQTLALLVVVAMTFGSRRKPQAQES